MRSWGGGKPCKCLHAGRGWGWEEGGVPLWGQWGERGTPGGGDTPGRAGKASHRGICGGTGTGTEGLAVRSCAGEAVPGSLLAAAADTAAPRTALSPRVPGKHLRRSAEHRAPRHPGLPGGDGRGWKEPSGYRQAFLPSPHRVSTSLRVRAAYFQAMLARKVAPVGQPPPALPPSFPPQPRTSRPPQSPRTPLRSGQRGNRLPRFPPRLLTICLNLLHLLF